MALVMLVAVMGVVARMQPIPLEVVMEGLRITKVVIPTKDRHIILITDKLSELK